MKGWGKGMKVSQLVNTCKEEGWIRKRQKRRNNKRE